MALTDIQKQQITEIVKHCLRQKFTHYKPQNNYMPFHFRLLGKDRMALYSFMQSLLTTFGTSIFEPVATALAKYNYNNVQCQYLVGKQINTNAHQQVQRIIADLSMTGKPNHNAEYQALVNAIQGNQATAIKPILADLYFEDANGEKYLFDLKTVKPNKGDFQKYKQTLLEWMAIELGKNINAQVHTYIAIPYNPYEPQPYQFWTVAGMLEIEYEMLVAKDFWDFLGGEGAYEDLLDCFELAGIELRPEIDNYFAQFNV